MVSSSSSSVSVSVSVASSSPTPSSASLSVDEESSPIMLGTSIDHRHGSSCTTTATTSTSYNNCNREEEEEQRRQHQAQVITVLAQLLYQRDWDGVFDVLFDDDGEPLLDIQDTCDDIDDNDNDENGQPVHTSRMDEEEFNICSFLDRLPLMEDNDDVESIALELRNMLLEEDRTRIRQVDEQQSRGSSNSNSPYYRRSDQRRSGENLLHAICQFQPPLDLVILVTQEWPFLVKQCDPITGHYPLHRAALYGCTSKVVKHLLEEYGDAALHPDCNGRLPLHLACRPIQWQPPLLPQVLSPSSQGRSSFDSTDEGSALSSHGELKKDDPDEHVKDDNGESMIDEEDDQLELEPIYIHAGSAVIRALCEHDSRAANIEDCDGCNALEIAIDHGLSKKICQLLLETSERAWKEGKQKEKDLRQQQVEERLKEWEDEQNKLERQRMLQMSASSSKLSNTSNASRRRLRPESTTTTEGPSTSTNLRSMLSVQQQRQPLSMRDLRAIEAGDANTYLHSTRGGHDMFLTHKKSNVVDTDTSTTYSSSPILSENSSSRSMVVDPNDVEAVLPLMRKITFNSLPPYTEMLNFYGPMAELKRMPGSARRKFMSSSMTLTKPSPDGGGKVDKTLQQEKPPTSLIRDGPVPRRKSLAAGIA